MSWRTFVCLLAALVTGRSSGLPDRDRIPAPDVPAGLEVNGPFRPFLKAHAIGTQNYICAPASTASGRAPRSL
jgi:hypothetical protein